MRPILVDKVFHDLMANLSHVNKTSRIQRSSRTYTLNGHVEFRTPGILNEAVEDVPITSSWSYVHSIKEFVQEIHKVGEPTIVSLVVIFIAVFRLIVVELELVICFFID
jgi:hypothetical protein